MVRVSINKVQLRKLLMQVLLKLLVFLLQNLFSSLYKAVFPFKVSFLRLLEKHNALQLPFAVFFCFSVTFFFGISGNSEQKIFDRPSNR